MKSPPPASDPVQPSREAGAIGRVVPANLAEALVQTARHHPGHGIHHLLADGSAHFQTYPELLVEASRMLVGLRAAGVRRGSPVLFQFELNPDFVPAYWACILGGYIPVPVSISPTYEQPHNTSGKLRNVWKMLGAPWVLAGDSLAPRLRAFAVREGLDGFQIATASQLRGHAPTTLFTPGGPDDLAILVLTSGSTGLPKAVRQTHRRLLVWALSVAASCEFTAAHVSLNWMPLDHVGGLLLYHVLHLVVGCTQVHATSEPVLRDPLVWLDWIHRYRVATTWAPNFAYALVNDQVAGIPPGRWDLSSLFFSLNGGEAIVSRTARRFLALLAPHGLPATAMRPAWGMSETGSAVTFSRRFTLDQTSDDDAFVLVGEPIEGIELRIADPSDQPVPEGRTGRLQIRGISVTEGYHENPVANRASFTADGWFNTGDLGVIRDGQLAITGREKDIIICNGVNFYSHELEAVVEELDGVEVSFTAACAIRPAGEDTDRIAIFFVPTPAAAGRLPEIAKAIRSAVARKEGVTPDFIVPLSRDDIPKTNIGKIQRALLKERFEQGAYTSALASVTAAPQSTAGRLFTPVWVDESLEPAVLPADSQVLILAESEGLGGMIAAEVRANGGRATLVAPGPGFASAVPGQYTINPESPGDFARLHTSHATPFTHVIHAWTVAPAQSAPISADGLISAQIRGSLALLRLVQSWPPEVAGPVRLLVVTSGAQAVSPANPVAWLHGALLGLARTLPHECPWLNCSALDLDGDDAAREARAVLQELAAMTTGEAARRAGRRLVPRLRSAPTTIATSAHPHAGVHVVSGGLGGIGSILARHLLLGTPDTHVLLLGRQPAAPGSKAAATLDELRAGAPGRVHYATCELTDPAALRATIAAAIAASGQSLGAVYHLAGRYHEAPLATETAEGFNALLTPKLLGAWALDSATLGWPAAPFVHFSSVLGQFGALNTGAYTAANAAVDQFAFHQHHSGRVVRSVQWSLWAGTGIGSQGSAEALAARGFRSSTPAEALEILGHAITSPATLLLSGLDPASRALRNVFDTSVTVAEAAPLTEHVAPRTDLERKLVRMWEQILGLPRVGIHDNFFELGGRSLIAARLFTRIQRELGRQLPLATLFRAPTVALLAALMSEGLAPPAISMLPLQTGGDAPAFFCIPGGGSDASIFRDLSVALGAQQPFYSLQAGGLDATLVEGPFPSVEEVAADFVRAIRSVQPAGPYRVGGHCFGCLLAWEVAVQLRAAGETVALLALLDPIVSNVFSGEIMGRDRLRYHFGKFNRLSLGGKLGYFAEKVRNFSRTVVARRRISQSYDMAFSMHSRYKLAACDLPTVVFLADDSFLKMAPERDPRRYYERLCGGGIRYFDARGDHHAILHPPGVAGLGEKLRAVLAEVRSAGSTSVTKSHP